MTLTESAVDQRHNNTTRVFPREPKSLLQANIQYHNLSQITDHSVNSFGALALTDLEIQFG